MKRIIRLTESDLTRIVRRVINEQSKKSVLDAGYSDDMYQFAVVYGTPTASAGDSKGVKITFNGLRFKSTDRKVQQEGTITLYGSCKNNSNPGFLSPRSVNDIETGGSGFVFDKGGIVDSAARNFCTKLTGVAPAGGKDADYMSWAKETMAKGLSRG